MTAPIDYAQRAGNRPAPGSWRPFHAIVEHTREMWEEFLGGHRELEGLSTSLSFWADIAEFQPVVNSHYPYHVIGVRLDSGGRLDYHAQANVSYIEHNPTHIEVAVGYVVFIPGQSRSILARLKNAFGSECPHPLCPEVDMESGSQFAGPGNHSTEANDFAAELGAWARTEFRVGGYANTPDWSGCWPTRPSWMKRRLAYYSASPTPAGYYSRQYYGALNYPVPHGYPTSCAPFGSWVDMNVTPRTISQAVADYRLTVPIPPPPLAPHYEGDEMPEIYMVDPASVPRGVSWPGYVLWPPLVHIEGMAAPSKVSNLATFYAKYGAAGTITYDQYLQLRSGLGVALKATPGDSEIAEIEAPSSDTPAPSADPSQETTQ